MPINTDLSVAPYFDDFNVDKNFHRVLFKPKQAVQARELTQLQTILQNQIERFGDNILVEGTIIKGGNFTDIVKLPYVKIRDNNINNQPVNILSYPEKARVVGIVSGVEAVIVTTLSGLESQTPDLNTLYVRYTKTGQDTSGEDIKTFMSGETLNVYVNDILVEELSVAVAPISADPNPIGNGYAVRCEDGIIFQKGNFIRFDPQIVIVTKYDTIPDELVVGFLTEEEIINSYNDTSLLDNAAGFDNYNAPGADRLKLIPKLSVLTKAEAQLEETFFAIQEYQDGRLVRRRTDTQFNSINTTLKKRTFEESGDYSVSGFSVSVVENPDDANTLSAMISPGVGYVGGERVEIISALAVDVPKGTDYSSVQQQNVVTNYGSYVELQSVIGNFASNSIYEVTLYSATQSATTLTGFTPSGTAIGKAFVRAARTNGSNIRLYVFGVRMNSGQDFTAVRSVVYGTNAFGNNVTAGGGIFDTGYRPLIYPLGKDAIRSVGGDNTDYSYLSAMTASAAANGQVQISLSGDDTFVYGASATLSAEQRAGIMASVTANGQPKAVTAASTDSTATTLTLNVGTVPAATNISLQVPVKRSNVAPSGKDLVTVYMRVNCNSFTTGVYSLGWPDVFKIEGVWRGANTTFTEASSGIVDVTDRFTLDTGQTHDFYGFSYIRKKSGFTLVNTDRLLVKAKVFRKNISGEYSQSFFAVNSYPVDDVTTPIPANKIRTQNIPSFTSANGAKYDLRDYIDFRPQVTALAAYSTTPAGATISTTAARLETVAFPADPTYLPDPSAIVELDYSFYLGRRDRLIIDETGEFVNIKGIASETPATPPEPQIGMTLATINIPPYPSLPSVLANRAGKPQYGVSLVPADNRRYTMRDIGNIEKRIERLEYYTVLSMLEKEAEDMVVTDSNGDTRFKNGIFVDNFNNLMIADTTDNAFSASVDPGESVLAPAFNSFTLDMIPSAYSNIRNNDKEVLSLPFTMKQVTAVTGASSKRNCVTDYYNYLGKVYCYPEYDNGYEETVAPDINMDVDLASAFVEYTNNLSKFVPLTNVSSTSKANSSTATKSSTSSATTAAGTTTTTTTTRTTTTQTTTKTITDALKVSLGNTTTKSVGDFVTNVSFSPFMRANVLRVYAVGLRPNTRYYFWFDGVAVNQYVAAAQMSDNKVKNAKRVGKFGDPIRSNARGEVCVFFSIPAGKFYTGDRDFVIIDADLKQAFDSATSSATFTYRGFNYSVEKTGLNISTRSPSYSTSTKVTTATRTSVKSDTSVTNTFVPAPAPEPDPVPEVPTLPWIFRREPGEGGGGDPIAQTFIIDRNMTNDTVMFIPAINLFFAAKSSTAGVTVQIREVDNGYPAAKVLAFGSVHKTASEVNVSPLGGVATQFRFDVPLTVQAGKEYAIVIIPDGNSPDYQVFVSKTGYEDLMTKKKIVSDESTGTLFTSTNNRAWTPHQDENIKHTLFKCQFAPSQGYVNMVPNNYEFFKLEEGAGTFRRGETVFVVNSNAAGTINITAGSKNVTGVGTAFNSLFAVGDYIAIRVATQDYEVSRIAEITSPTAMVLDETMKTTITGRNYFKTVTGTVDYSNASESRLHLKSSSAKSGQVFAAGNTIRGEITESVGVIAEVLNVPISYVQNHFYRSNFTNTATTLTYSRLSNALGTNTLSGLQSASFDSNDYFNANIHIFSRSNEITSFSGARTFVMRMSLENTKSYLDSSPMFDYDISSVHCFEYIVNNDATDETENEGAAQARYVSKVVSLADGLDSQDLKLWMTAYRPQGTDIRVYGKFKSSTDATDIKDVKWTELKRLDATNFYSSSANREDYREFQFEMPATGTGATFTETNGFNYTAGDGSIHTSYKYFAIKIVMLSTASNRIPKVKDMRAIALT